MDDSERSYGYSQDIFHGRRGAGGDYGERMVRGNGGPTPIRTGRIGKGATSTAPRSG